MTVYHVIPETGILEHEKSVSCWCAPTLKQYSAVRDTVAVHNAYDDNMNPIQDNAALATDDTEEGIEDEEE